MTSSASQAGAIRAISYKNRPPAAPQAPHSYSQPRTHNYTDDDDHYDGAFAYDDPPCSRERQLQNDDDEILKQRMQLRNQDTIDHDQDHTPRATMRPPLGGQDLPQAASPTSILNAPPSPSPARIRHPSNAMPMTMMPSPHRKTNASASPASSPPSVTKQRSYFSVSLLALDNHLARRLCLVKAMVTLAATPLCPRHPSSSSTRASASCT
ncbi:hypothetical protein HGRIS_013973 [Hohenbuehelia grisea]|uniref:Uncharacterized protein n=1 Tax=Hohenbuehelia grisea TaxID=104357 RepID=A0ABR3JS75_9AGAR